MPELFGRFKSVAVTPQGGSAITTNHIYKLSHKAAREKHEDFAGNSDQPSIYYGNNITEVTLETGDAAFYMSLVDGIRCTGLTIKYEAPATDIAAPTGATTLDDAKELTLIMSSCYVAEALELEGSADGKPVRFTITWKICKNAAGQPGTVNITHAA